MMGRIKMWLGILMWVIGCSTSSVWAQSNDLFPKPMTPPRLVNDFANFMSSDEIAALEKKLLDYNQTSSCEIAIVTVNTIGNYDIAQYGTILFNQWGIGASKNNSGVLVVASRQEQKVNITVGYGLEGALTDMTSGQIIRHEIVPAFKEGAFYKGFDRAVDAILAATEGEYTADPSDDSEDLPAILPIILIIIILVIVLSKKGGGGGGYVSRRGYRGWMGSGPIIGGGFGSGGFSGGFGGGSSGGFGGFGGGMSGGGGASGSW
jgi:uncharacterized protein